MKFVQLIEFKTGDIDAFNRTLDEWLAKTSGVRTPTRATQGRDRDNERTYIHIVEFPSYEAAMENSNRPETAEFAGMPQAAIATGGVDLVLPLDEIGPTLLELVAPGERR